MPRWRLRWRLRTLLIAVAALAVLLAPARWCWQARQRWIINTKSAPLYIQQANLWYGESEKFYRGRVNKAREQLAATPADDIYRGYVDRDRNALKEQIDRYTSIADWYGR